MPDPQSPPQPAFPFAQALHITAEAVVTRPDPANEPAPGLDQTPED